ncbi:MAG: hypothetical protein P1V20_10085 [Verrucomicrobiales bacterium]|nr:hypothetical protein [Verrucomicrobiales bacterium]
MKEKKFRKDNASVLVVALVVCAIGTIGVLATVSIIGARSSVAEAQYEGLDRRVRFNNSMALGREVLYQNHLGDEAVLDSETTYSYSTWASVKVGAFDSPALSFGDAARTHPTGAAPGRAFSRDIAVKVNDGVAEYPMQYQLRSYNPALGGDLLSIHPTAEVTAEQMRISGDLKVKGRAVFWGGDYYQDVSSTVRSEEVIVPKTNAPKLVLENPDEEAIKPSNYIGYKQTMGKVASGNSYGGELDIVDNSETGVNSYISRLASLGGEANIDGIIEVTDGLGVDSVAPKLNDSTLIGLIQDLGQAVPAVVGLLAANSPLSSDVMMALINRVPSIGNTYLIPLLNAQAPLPDDIMIDLGDPVHPVGEAARKALLKSTGFSYISDGSGTVTVNLDSVYLPNLILDNVTRLELLGQDTSVEGDAAKLMQPRAVVIKNSDNVFLSRVHLDGLTNQRRMALAISQTGVLDGAGLIDSSGNPSALGTNQTIFLFTGSTPYVQWRMITETEGVSQHWDVTGVSTATLFGGIRADHSIRVSGGTLFLDQEEDTEFIESLVSRNAWIETYK